MNEPFGSESAPFHSPFPNPILQLGHCSRALTGLLLLSAEGQCRQWGSYSRWSGVESLTDVSSKHSREKEDERSTAPHT